MKICYIAHPIGGDIEANLADLRRIIAKINRQAGAMIVPFVPYYADAVSMDDTLPADRDRAIRNNTAILVSGIVQEVWLTGDQISPGMEQEIKVAKNMSIPVIDFIGLL